MRPTFHLPLNPTRESRIYAVFVGSKWAMTRNGRRAVQYAKRNAGYVGFVRDYPGAPRTYDAPTFRVLMTPLADYRQGISA